MSQSFDVIVIGTGQSGPPLAAQLASAGQRVAIIERGRFGGTCVNTGCIPTKALVASARVAYVARHAAQFGVEIDGPIRLDMRRVMSRKEEISATSRTGVESMLSGTQNCTVFRGQGRFVSNCEVAVGGDILSSKQIFINVGGKAAIPDLPGLSGVPYFTNSSILKIDFLPSSLIIVGGSYIGLEFAQMFKRFGSEVTIMERGPRLLSTEDEDVSHGVLDILVKEGIAVKLNAEGLEFSREAAGIRVRVNSGDVRGTHVLIATGRKPNTEDLGLETTGVLRDPRDFVRVDDELRTSVPGIWAIGDCNGRGGFTHTSYNDYEIVAANLLDNDHRRITDRITAYCVFIDPPLGRVGMTESQVRASGRKALIAKREMSKVGRAYEKSETQGFMKILVDAATQQILGASILGTGGDEAIHCIRDVMYSKSPYTVLQRAVHIHPTVSELIPTMLGVLQPLC